MHLHFHIHEPITIIVRQDGLKEINQKLDQIMSTQAEAAETLREVLAQQQKTVGEIQTLQTEVTTLKVKIDELQAMLDNGGEVGEELQAAIDAVKAQAQIVDDAIPDVVVPEPEPPIA